MTEQQLRQVKAQLSQGETFKKAYRAFEGDIRVVSEDRNGREYRYRVIFHADDSVSIERF